MEEVLDNPAVIDLLSKVAGATSVEILRQLSEVREVDEFTLAERVGMDVKMVRKILYKLYQHRIVNFRKIKDEESGWYIYLWSFDAERIRSLLEKRRREMIKKLREKLEYEKNNQFFVCENGCTRVTLDKAMETGFVCPICGGKLVFYDNSAVIRQLEEQLKVLEKTFGF